MRPSFWWNLFLYTSNLKAKWVKFVNEFKNKEASWNLKKWRFTKIFLLILMLLFVFCPLSRLLYPNHNSQAIFWNLIPLTAPVDSSLPVYLRLILFKVQRPEKTHLYIFGDYVSWNQGRWLVRLELLSNWILSLDLPTNSLTLHHDVRHPSATHRA